MNKWILVFCLLFSFGLEAKGLFKNPLFSYTLYNHDNDLRDEWRLKENGVKDSVRYDECKLVKNEASFIEYHCYYDKKEQDYDKYPYFSLKFYSIGKGSNGFCEVRMIATSDKERASGELVFWTSRSDCGEINNQQMVGDWIHKPKKKFSRFKNPMFNYELHPYANQQGNEWLYVDKIVNFFYIKRVRNCILLENNQDSLFYECDVFYAAGREPYKEYHEYKLIKEVESKRICAEVRRSGSFQKLLDKDQMGYEGTFYIDDKSCLPKEDE